MSPKPSSQNATYRIDARRAAKVKVQIQLKKIISPILNFLLEPLLCRIDDRIRPSLDAISQRLERIEPQLMPIAIKNEMQSLAALPTVLLEKKEDVVVVGHFPEDAVIQILHARPLKIAEWQEKNYALTPPLPATTVVFLDELYFMQAMKRLATPLLEIRDSIVIATQFRYLTELQCRRYFHQLGFMEVALVHTEPTSHRLDEFSVSHTGPIGCEPVYLDTRRPPQDLSYQITWLIARRIPIH